jgi:O-antigen/teichoic acid export membrane protein
VVLLLSLQVLLSQHTSLLYAGFFSDGRYARGTVLMSLIRLLELTALLVVVCLGGRLQAAAGAIATARLVGNGAMWWQFRRVNGWIAIGVGSFSMSTMKRLIRPALGFLLFPVGNAVSLQGSILAVGYFLGSPAVVAFSVLRTLSRVLTFVLYPLGKIAGPEISSAFGRGDLSLLYRLHRYSCRIALWAGGLIAFGVLAGGTVALRVWTHGQVSMNWPVLSILTLAAVVNVFWSLSNTVEYATNRHERVAIAYVLVSTASLAMVCALLPRFGLTGAALGVLACELSVASIVVKQALGCVGDSLSQFAAAVLQPPRAADLMPVVARLTSARWPNRAVPYR